MSDEPPPGVALDHIELTGYADVRSALRDHHQFTTAGAIDCGQQRPLLPLQLEPPEHAATRRILDAALAEAMEAGLPARIRVRCIDLLEALPRLEPVDLAHHYVRPVPVLVLLEVLGLEEHHADEVRELHDLVLRPGGPSREQRRASARVYDFFARAEDEVRQSGRSGLMASLSMSELPPEDVMDTCFTLLLAGIDPVAQALASGLVLVATGKLVPSASGKWVDELVRWGAPVVAVPRLTTCPWEGHGQPVAAGASVSLALGSANRDGAVFEQPEQFDVDRRGPAHLGFGAGPHRCPGAGLARMQLRIALSTFAAVTQNVELVAPPSADEVRASTPLLAVLGER